MIKNMSDKPVDLLVIFIVDKMRGIVNIYVTHFIYCILYYVIIFILEL